jgi:predicted dehydrogenase
MEKITQVLVIGNGRWAKVYTNEIIKCFGDSVAVYLCASRRTDEIRQWANNQAGEIQVVDRIPSVADEGIAIAFVANSAYEHESAIKDALLRGYHVIVEKPFTISSEQSQQVIELAHQMNRAIFSTNTFRFASYLEDFKNLLPSDKTITRIDLLWTDPGIEERYGERKNYDSRLPIVMDVLPHVVSILETIFPFEAVALRSLQIKRGGAEVDLHLSFGPSESHVQMSRVSDKRRRILTVWQDSICHELDFSTEPGIVFSSTHRFAVDPSWESKVKPIANMLYSVTDFFENGVEDSRLNVATAIKANRLIDSALPIYRAQQAHDLLESLCKRNGVQNSDVRYALVESMQQSRKLASENIELMLDILDELTTQITKASDLKEDLLG